MVHGPDRQGIVDEVASRLPDVQAIYLFGSTARGDAWPGSDVDIALLLPPDQAARLGGLYGSELHAALERRLGSDVDLVNLRRVPTVLQKEVLADGERIATRDRYAAEEFEMLVLSFYQKLNQERAGILADGLRSGRFYAV